METFDSRRIAMLFKAVQRECFLEDMGADLCTISLLVSVAGQRRDSRRCNEKSQDTECDDEQTCFWEACHAWCAEQSACLATCSGAMEPKGSPDDSLAPTGAGGTFALPFCLRGEGVQWKE